jgi:hypothetical protein
VRLSEVAALFAANLVWRVSGAGWAARRLVAGLASTDETARTVAAILIVRGGRRAVPWLREELARPRNLPVLIGVMGDAAPDEFRADLERLARAPEPDVARAAAGALRVIEARAGRTGRQGPG